MSSNGTVKLQKIIKGLQGRGVMNGLSVQDLANNILLIEKRTVESESRTEFSFQIRVDHVGGRDIWCPISYRSLSGEMISCETILNGKTFTNFVKQDALIELAESWAKTLEAQLVAKTVDNVLR